MSDDENAVGPNTCPCREFWLYAGGILLGHALLDYEYAGDDGWVRCGEFFPAVAYYEHKPLFQRHTDIAYDARERERQHALLEQLETKIGNLKLRLVASDGSDVPTISLRLQDCADTLTDSPYQLEAFIQDRQVYERVFAKSTT